MAARLTQADRRRVRDFIRHVQSWSGRPWDELIYKSGVPGNTVHGWRYGRATPEAPGLIEFLRAAGMLDEHYRIRLARPLTAEEAAEQAAAAAESLGRIVPAPQPRADQRRGAERRSR